MSNEHKWTPEPWELDAENEFPWCIRVVAGDDCVFEMRRVAHSSKADSLDDVRNAVGFPFAERDGIADLVAEQEANAARIVACVNACAGIPSEMLSGSDFSSTAKRIVAQRDALAGLLRSVLNNRHACFIPEDGVNCPGTLLNWTERARAALAKVTP